MTADPNELRRLRDLYADMSDGEVEKLASEENSLTDEAQDALDDELDRRGLRGRTANVDDSPAGDAHSKATPQPAASDLHSEDVHSEDSRYEAMPQPDFQQLVTIREFRDLPAALLAQGLLQSSGIECFLDNANIVRMDWFYSNAVGGIKLRVRPEDAQAALEILKQPIPAGFNVDDIGIYEQPKCPACQSLDVAYEELNKPWSYVTMAINIPIPIYNRGWNCHACGHEWMDETESETGAQQN